MVDIQYIYSCILWHAIEEYHELYLSLAKELATDYIIEDIAGGVIAWKWVDEETIYFWETKDQFEDKGKWAFKVLRAMKEIPKREGAKKIQIDSRSERVKSVMERKGFKVVDKVEEKLIPNYVLIKEV